MEFKFPVNEIFKQPLVEIGANLIPPGFSGDRRSYWDTVGKVSEVVNAMGEASATAQGLTKPITTAERLRNSEHTIYLLVDQNAGNGRGAVTGLLKTGKKGLYVFDRNGQHFQVSPPCVLDFYVHESRQRNGLGKRLFEHMLQKEQVEPVKMAIDRPSEKFLGFLNKHYTLNNPVKQMNNYVVFDGFFPSTPEKNAAAIEINNQSALGKKLSANGLQAGNYASPMGRYGAPRPLCSMGQIIHNQSSTLSKSTEPTGTRSVPETNFQSAANNNSPPLYPKYSTQSSPNMYYQNNDQHQEFNNLSNVNQQKHVRRVNSQQNSDNVWQSMHIDGSLNPENYYSSGQDQNVGVAPHQQIIEPQIHATEFNQLQQMEQQQLFKLQQQKEQQQREFEYHQLMQQQGQQQRIIQPKVQQEQQAQHQQQQHLLQQETQLPYIMQQQAQQEQNLQQHQTQQQQLMQQQTQQKQILQQQPQHSQFLQQTQVMQPQLQQEQFLQQKNQQPNIVQDQNQGEQNMQQLAQHQQIVPQQVRQQQIIPQQAQQQFIQEQIQQEQILPQQAQQEQILQQHQVLPEQIHKPNSTIQQQQNILKEMLIPAAPSRQYLNGTQTTPRRGEIIANYYQQPFNAPTIINQRKLELKQPISVRDLMQNFEPPLVKNQYENTQNIQYHQQGIIPETISTIKSQQMNLGHAVPQTQHVKTIHSQYQMQPLQIQTNFVENTQNMTRPQSVVSSQVQIPQPVMAQQEVLPSLIMQNNNMAPHTYQGYGLTSQPEFYDSTNSMQNLSNQASYDKIIQQPNTTQSMNNAASQQIGEQYNNVVKTQGQTHDAGGDMGANAGAVKLDNLMSHGYPPQISGSDTQVVDDIVSSSPKLERPRSLSIQLSEEQQINEEKKIIDENIDVESEVQNEVPIAPPTPDDEFIVEDVKKLTISQQQESDDKSPGKRTPSHLTEQGFFDLKFYHNKLW